MKTRSIVTAAIASIAAMGSIVSDASAALVNVALGGKPASQSSEAHGGVASRAVDGNTDGNWGAGSTTHTNDTSNNPWWRLDLGATIPVESITIFNRTDCCSGRLSDIVVDFYDAQNNLILSSPELNDNNGGNTNSHAGPGSLSLTLDTPTAARFVEVRRNGSSIFGNPAIAGDTGEDNILSLAEVQVFATNYALNKPATQTTNYDNTQYLASNATNGILTDFTHTLDADPTPSLTIDLQVNNIAIDSVILHNRDSCCGARLRDIVLELMDENGNVLAISDILNEGGVLGSPAFIAVDFEEMFGRSMVASMLRISRIRTTAGDGGVLSLGEVQVFGQAVPEPMTAMLGIMGLAALASRTGRRQRA